MLHTSCVLWCGSGLLRISSRNRVQTCRETKRTRIRSFKWPLSFQPRHPAAWEEDQKVSNKVGGAVRAQPRVRCCQAGGALEPLVHLPLASVCSVDVTGHWACSPVHISAFLGVAPPCRCPWNTFFRKVGLATHLCSSLETEERLSGGIPVCRGALKARGAQVPRELF